MRRLLATDEEWVAAIRSFERTAFRLELQPKYDEPGEIEDSKRYAAGDRTLPTDDPGWSRWLAHVSSSVATGKRIERVRVFEDPPTDYQVWLRWVSQLNLRAGEVQRYMSRSNAVEVGVMPAGGLLEDWWLLDGERLVLMRFTPAGERHESALIADSEVVAQAQATWDLAVRHSVADVPPPG